MRLYWPVPAPLKYVSVIPNFLLAPSLLAHLHRWASRLGANRPTIIWFKALQMVVQPALFNQFGLNLLGSPIFQAALLTVDGTWFVHFGFVGYTRLPALCIFPL